MLEFFRQHVGGGLIGVLLVGLLAVAFAFSFGAQSKGWGEGQSQEIAAVAAGYDISESTLEYAYNLLGGRGMNNTDSDAVALRLSALEGLIERGLLLESAQKMGVTASSDEAVDRIVESEISLTRPLNALFERMEAYPFFNPSDATEILVSAGHQIPQSFKNDEGEFNLEFYKTFIRSHLRQTEENFIEQQRLEIIAERMRELMVSGIRISDAEVRSEYDRENDTATIRYIRIIPAYFADKLRPTQEEIDAYAKANAEEIKKNYEANQFKYTDLEEQVKARHILIKVEKDATEEVKASAKTKIEDLLQRIKNGEDFATLAQEFSEDPGSGKKGGDLGYNPKGRMVPKFDEVMFALKPGELSNVVETEYGFHIIKVEGKRKGNVSLEEATPEIAEKLYRETKGAEEAKKTAESFVARSKAGEKLDALLPKEQEKGPLAMKLATSRKFSATATSIPGIGPAEEMVKAAFKDDKEAKHFEVGGDHYIMEVAERNKPNDKEFQEKKDELSGKLLAMKQATFLVKKIAEMRSAAEADGRVKIVYQPQSAAVGNDDAPKTDIKKDKKTSKKSSKSAKTKKDKTPSDAKKETPKPAAENKENTPDNKEEANGE